MEEHVGDAAWSTCEASLSAAPQRPTWLALPGLQVREQMGPVSSQGPPWEGGATRTGDMSVQGVHAGYCCPQSMGAVSTSLGRGQG